MVHLKLGDYVSCLYYIASVDFEWRGFVTQIDGETVTVRDIHSISTREFHVSQCRVLEFARPDLGVGLPVRWRDNPKYGVGLLADWIDKDTASVSYWMGFMMYFSVPVADLEIADDLLKDKSSYRWERVVASSFDLCIMNNM